MVSVPGLAPVAQGTFGSLAALLPWLLLRELPLPLYVLVLLLGFARGRVGVQRGQSRAAAWPITAASCGTNSSANGSPCCRCWCWLRTGSALDGRSPASRLFRLFDVWKPWPISWLDRRVKGGLGVMIDDVLAGVFAAIVLALGLHFLP